MVFPVNVDSTWVNTSASYDAGELRRADSAAFAGAGGALGVSGGIVRHGDTSLAVTVDASDNVTIQAGAVVIPGNAVAGTGCYRSALAAATTNALSARSAVNPRIDLIVFRQMDTDVVGAHAAYTGRIEAIAGTPSATPSAPALPSMAVELARITVPISGGASASVDSSFRTYAASLGGIMPVGSFASLPASAAKFQRAVALDTGTRYEWTGSAWQSPAQFRGRPTANVSLPNATITPIPLGVEDFDSANMHDNVTNNSRVTIAVGQGGTYLITGMVYHSAISGQIQARLHVNGTGNGTTALGVGNSSGVALQFTDILVLAAGDYVELAAFQASGGAANANIPGTLFALKRLD